MPGKMAEGLPEQKDVTSEEYKPLNKFGNDFLNRSVHVEFVSLPSDDKWDPEKLGEYDGGV